jgi:squalene monooxygenase
MSQDHILTKIVPELPSSLHIPIHNALEKERLRRMPNSFLPAAEQGGKSSLEGVILLGDSWNMRHPLTGGGMTVALNDVVLLSQLLGDIDDLNDWDRLSDVLHRWHWGRKPLSSTINILSVALYDLFRADGEYFFIYGCFFFLLTSSLDEELAILRTGCFKYFECGGECINGPVSLLSG